MLGKTRIVVDAQAEPKKEKEIETHNSSKTNATDQTRKSYMGGQSSMLKLIKTGLNQAEPQKGGKVPIVFGMMNRKAAIKNSLM